MPYRRDLPLVKEFTLDKSDILYGVTGEATKVRIRQASQAAHERREALYANVIREMRSAVDGQEDTVRLIQHFSLQELKRIEVMLTLAGCNIEDERGKHLFDFTEDHVKSESQFREAWGSLPPIVCDEIHEKVLEVNIDWNPEGK